MNYCNNLGDPVDTGEGGLDVGGALESIWEFGRDKVVEKGSEAIDKQMDEWFGTGGQSGGQEVQPPLRPTGGQETVTPPVSTAPKQSLEPAGSGGINADSLISKAKQISPILLAGAGGALTKLLSKSWLAAGLVGAGTYFLTDKMQKSADAEAAQNGSYPTR